MGVEVIVDVLVQQTVEEKIEVPKIFSQERIQQVAVEQVLDVPVLQTVEQVIEVPTTSSTIWGTGTSTTVSTTCCKFFSCGMILVPKLFPTERVQQVVVEQENDCGHCFDKWIGVVEERQQVC